MAAAGIALLAVGVLGAVAPPRRVPQWLVPALAAAVAVASGVASGAHALAALRSLAQPVGFLLAAVPLAVLLDRLGFFPAAARLLSRSGSLGGLWLLAAAVTTVFNLDASVVLLTPLYVRLARRVGADPLALAIQPLVLSWLASSALPVSNLTNLIASSESGAGSVAFLQNLALPSVGAAAIGWLAYRRRFAGRIIPAKEGPSGATPGERRALCVGGVVVAGVLAGFVAGRQFGVAEWEVAVAADLVLVVLVRGLPWRAVPAGTGIVALSLGVLATAAAGNLPVHAILGSASLPGLLRSAGVAAGLANAVNNLPALLVILPALHHHSGPTLWAVLLGVNMGPVLLVTGTLASLLWVSTLRRLEVPVRARDVSYAGLRIGLPGAAAGLAVLLALRAAGIGA